MPSPRSAASALFFSLIMGCGGGGAAVDRVAGEPAAGSPSAVLTSVEVAPGTPTIAVGATAQLSATARDQNSSPMSGVPVATWTSSNNSVVTINGSGAAIGVAAGSAVVTASISSGGATRTGTATVTVLAPAAPAAPGASPTAVTVTTPNLTFSPATVTVGTGASVTWQFSGATHNVTFGALKPTGGDVPDTSPGSAASRVFGTAGTYSYECTRHSGMAGQVVVSGGAAPPPGTTPPPTPPSTSGTLVQATLAAFTPERVEIAPGGTVTWEFIGGSNGIVFEDLAPPGGNIPQSSAGTRVSRTFPAAGDYDYRSSVNSDVKGRVRVR